MHSVFGKLVCERTVSEMKEIKPKNRNWMADETLDESCWIANTWQAYW